MQSWCPYLEKDIDEIEKVQHRITKLVPGFQDLPYEERCRRLKLPSLKDRRRRGDLIEVYKILNSHEGSDYTKFFKLSQKYNQRPQMEVGEEGAPQVFTERRMVCD